MCKGVQKTYGCGHPYGFTVTQPCEAADTLNSLPDGSQRTLLHCPANIYIPVSLARQPRPLVCPLCFRETEEVFEEVCRERVSSLERLLQSARGRLAGKEPRENQGRWVRMLERRIEQEREKRREKLREWRERNGVWGDG